MDDTLLRLLDTIGVVAFAISGATLGVRRRLDLFGVLVLGAVTATAGGVMRDILMGAMPPTAVADWRPLTTAGLAGLATFYFEPVISRFKSPVQLFDAAGLGVFAVVSTQKALVHGIPVASAMLLGVIGAVGGGAVRDVMTAQVPNVLRAEIYAVAALVGTAFVAVADTLEWESPAITPAAVLAVFLMRVVAIRRAWSLPTSPHRPNEPPPPPLPPPA